MLLRESFSEISLRADTAITMHYGGSKRGQCVGPPCWNPQLTEEQVKKNEGEKRGVEEKQEVEEETVLLNWIFNHSLSFVVASQLFSSIKERHRRGRVTAGDGKNTKYTQ